MTMIEVGVRSPWTSEMLFCLVSQLETIFFLVGTLSPSAREHVTHLLPRWTFWRNRSSLIGRGAN